MNSSKKNVGWLVVDTTAFIQNAPLQDVAENIVTCKEVIDEITNKRQLRRLVVLPYDLIVKDVFPEHVQIVTEFSKKTGDYPSLSATDIKIMALTYQLEKEKVGTTHLRTEPLIQRSVNMITTKIPVNMNPDVTGFFMPRDTQKSSNSEKEIDGKLSNELGKINSEDENDEHLDEILQSINEDELQDEDVTDSNEEDDNSGWITPRNVSLAKKQLNSDLIEDKPVDVACMTTDFAMQNVLRQINLHVAALDGRIIQQLRTFVLRCYSCFKTTSIMTKKFCPKCGNDTLKKVAVSLDANGKLQIHINARRPLTSRGKKFSLPRIKGGKHPQNPILVDDQPMPHNRPTRLARMKNNPLDDDYIAGFSPFVMRDVNSKSAQLHIKPGQEIKYWMRKNPNEAHRKRK